MKPFPSTTIFGNKEHITILRYHMSPVIWLLSLFMAVFSYSLSTKLIFLLSNFSALSFSVYISENRANIVRSDQIRLVKISGSSSGSVGPIDRKKQYSGFPMKNNMRIKKAKKSPRLFSIS